MTTANLDRETSTHALLIASDGRIWDVNGSDWAELKTDADEIAASEGLTIEIYNSELPET
mgnify:FL=1|tara:strand:- start:586 stop:765 length:180 start_codon:yes stop_codon:yes gene_type:complete